MLHPKSPLGVSSPTVFYIVFVTYLVLSNFDHVNIYIYECLLFIIIVYFKLYVPLLFKKMQNIDYVMSAECACLLFIMYIIYIYCPSRLRYPRLWLRTIAGKSTCGGSVAFPWEAHPKGGKYDGV